MILWQSTKKPQNCVGGDACRSLPIAHQQPSNPPMCLLIIMINSRKRVYYSVFQGESDYQLYFSIGALVLWQSAKNTQNYVQIPIPPDFCWWRKSSILEAKSSKIKQFLHTL
jgi:hypothetical protein